MTIRTRLSVCRRKRVFANVEEARAAAVTFGAALLPYRCDRCGRVHLTSRTKGKRVALRHPGEGRGPATKV